MVNLVEFEKQLAAITDYYNEISSLRERQKDDGVMIRIFLDEIKPMYARILESINSDTVLPANVKSKLIELVQWELERAPGREAIIDEYEKTYKEVFTQGYDGELAENSKLEAPFAIMAEAYNKIRNLREGQKNAGVMGRIYLDEIIPMYQALREKVFNTATLTDGIKEEILALIDEEIRLAPIREDEIIEAERAYADEYTKAYNAALARYDALSPLLKLKYADQLKRLHTDDFMSIKQINKLFLSEKEISEQSLPKKEAPDSQGDDGEHDGH